MHIQSNKLERKKDWMIVWYNLDAGPNIQVGMMFINSWRIWAIKWRLVLGS